MALEQAENDIAEPVKPVEPIDGAAKQARKNEQSTIEFPYNDLDDAVEIANSIHKNAGVSCSPDQVAAYLGKSLSGPFRARLSNARMFGVTLNEKGTVTLTELGRRITDSATTAEARADAFLSVELYKKLFEKYRGFTLPGSKGIEQEMVALGVSSKQADRARQAFMRSAKQGGFFTHGEERLVKPVFSAAPTTKPVEIAPEEKPKEKSRGGSDEPPSGLHPFIVGLLQTLPKATFSETGTPETDWPSAARAKWLQTAANIFDLIYKGEGGIDVRSATAQRSPRPD